MAERKNIIKQCSLNSVALISSVKYARLSKNLAFIFACLFAPATRCVWIFLSIFEALPCRSLFYFRFQSGWNIWYQQPKRSFSSLVIRRSVHLYSQIKRSNSCFPRESRIIPFPYESQEVFVQCRQTIQNKTSHFQCGLKYGWATLLKLKVFLGRDLLLPVQYFAISMSLKTTFCHKSFKEDIFWALLNACCGGRQFSKQRCVWALLFFPIRILRISHRAGWKEACSQQITFVCQRFGKLLFLGKLVPVHSGWMASPGQSFPNCGLQSPQGHGRVQRGLWRVRKNSAGQQLLTFSWLEERGRGFTRLSLQHQF